jgi:hypothetical protein
LTKKAILGAIAGLASVAAVPAVANAWYPPPPQKTGFLEICKNSDKTHPVTGMFQFQIDGPNHFSEQVSVPVGACTMSLQVPAGTNVVTEEGNVSVVSISATPAANLLSSDLKKATATVKVAEGGVATETIVTFTNQQVPGTGLLKVCKNAGDGVKPGDLFTFWVSGENTPVEVPAGYCVIVATSIPSGTDVVVKEHVPKGDEVTAIEVAGAAGLDFSSLKDAVAKVNIGTGVNEVIFTNRVHREHQGPPPPPPPPPPVSSPPPPPPPPVVMPPPHQPPPGQVPPPVRHHKPPKHHKPFKKHHKPPKKHHKPPKVHVPQHHNS